jgi:hypothetical protein
MRMVMVIDVNEHISDNRGRTRGGGDAGLQPPPPPHPAKPPKTEI